MSSTDAAREAPRSPGRRRALLLVPLGIAAAAGAGFWAMLRGLSTGDYDPHGVPSALIGKPAPPLDLPPLEGTDRPGLAASDLASPGRPILVNFFASWCVPCVAEAPMLARLAQQGIPLLGVVYKDKPADALGFLRRHGNPYRKLGQDREGRAAIDWGLYGVPETYLVDPRGIIRFRWAGPVTDRVVDDLLPLLKPAA